MRVLGIETSCDETSAAVVVRDGQGARIEGLTVLSQDVHRIFGGVVPELASRAHLVAIDRVVSDALSQAGVALGTIDGVAVTRGPGLLGALLVGVNWSKAVAWRHGLPIIGVHHLEGHLFAPTLESPDVAPPFTALLVSGGHTMLLDVPAWGAYRLLGQTRDDAAGEAFDKVGSLLHLDYPAGPALERLARDGDPARFRFPRPLLHTGAGGHAARFEFSFSGLKTAVLRAVEQSGDLERDRADLARGFQDAAIDVMVTKSRAAADEFGRAMIVLGGGVACNQALVVAMRDAVGPVRVAVASPRLNTDNAAMIAAAGSWRLMNGQRDGLDLDATDSLALPGLVDVHQEATW